MGVGVEGRTAPTVCQSLCSIDIMRKASGARQGAWAFLGPGVTPLQSLPACLPLLHSLGESGGEKARRARSQEGTAGAPSSDPGLLASTPDPFPPGFPTFWAIPRVVQGSDAHPHPRSLPLQQRPGFHALLWLLSTLSHPADRGMEGTWIIPTLK